MGKIIVIGAGAAGMMAAAQAAASGHKVLLLEKNEKLGKKIYITGKGRCNLTNACGMEDLPKHVLRNRKFLYSAFYGFTNMQAIEFFEAHGLATKIERGERVFPVSDHSSDVIRSLQRALQQEGVEVRLHTQVKEVLADTAEKTAACMEKCDAKEPTAYMEECVAEEPAASAQKWDKAGPAACTGEHSTEELEISPKNRGGKSRKGQRAQNPKRQITGVRLSNGAILPADAVIIATGGCSYVSTGSTGDGYRFARELGHTVTELRPSLVPFETAEPWVKELQGLSLRNVKVRIKNGKKAIYEGFGEMLFTHFGVSGPLILSASSIINDDMGKLPLPMEIDLKPALSMEQLDNRILRDFGENTNRQFKNGVQKLFPAKLLPVIVSLSGIDPEKKINEVTKEERQSFAKLIKSFPLTVTKFRGFNEAVITRGGVCVKEVNPSTMESKLVSGLYFAGEVLDVDALTGGFNLQIAWSTGHLAGKSACPITQ